MVLSINVHRPTHSEVCGSAEWSSWTTKTWEPCSSFFVSTVLEGRSTWTLRWSYLLKKFEKVCSGLGTTKRSGHSWGKVCFQGERDLDGQPCTQTDRASLQLVTFPVNRSYNPWVFKVASFYERSSMETHCEGGANGVSFVFAAGYLPRWPVISSLFFQSSLFLWKAIDGNTFWKRKRRKECDDVKKCEGLDAIYRIFFV